MMDTGAISAERLAGLRAGTGGLGRVLACQLGRTGAGGVPGPGGGDQPRGRRRTARSEHEELLWDAARVLATDRRIQLYGVLAYTVVARHDATGELGGLTGSRSASEPPGWGFQALTAVARAHRGHRLGLRLKLAMLELLARQEPQVTHIMTRNAETNAHMIGINEELGYCVVG